MTWLLTARTAITRTPREVWIALGVLVIVFGVYQWYTGAIDDARDEGAQVQREGDLRETIERTETANETRESIQSQLRSGGGDDLYAQCLRTARTPANCERFLHGSETPDR